MAQINTYSPDGRERLCIQWDRDGGQVMVGVQRAEEKPLLQDGRPVKDEDGNALTNWEFDDLGGIWMAVDRGGSNNIIRSVREGRDKAFGKDE